MNDAAEAVRNTSKFSEIKLNAGTIMLAVSDSSQALILLNLKNKQTRKSLWHKVKLYMQYAEYAEAIDKLMLDGLLRTRMVKNSVAYIVHIQHFRRAAHHAAFSEMREKLKKRKTTPSKNRLL